jgi:hypothetical protein
MGTILDTVYEGTSQIHQVQTYGVPPGSGAIVEFLIPESEMSDVARHAELLHQLQNHPIDPVASMPTTTGVEVAHRRPVVFQRVRDDFPGLAIQHRDGLLRCV